MFIISISILRAEITREIILLFRLNLIFVHFVYYLYIMLLKNIVTL